MADMRSNRSAKKDSSIVLKGFFYLFIFFLLLFIVFLLQCAWLPGCLLCTFYYTNVITSSRGKKERERFILVFREKSEFIFVSVVTLYLLYFALLFVRIYIYLCVCVCVLVMRETRGRKNRDGAAQRWLFFL